jgi:hypothetical protein
MRQGFCFSPVEETHFDPSMAAGQLLSRVGRHDAVEAHALPGGRNNLVWRISAGEQAFLLKRYFWSGADPRDRLGQEWLFLTFLRRAGIFRAPEPIARDESRRCVLLEFIEGQALLPQEVEPDDVRAATAFFLEMNARRDLATHLPGVSEACFSLSAHVQTTERRIARLDAITDPDAKDLVQSQLRPAWGRITSRIHELPAAEREHELPAQERCLSPSDFGFHNSLRQPDGTLRFVDFEYAGWDDPAKTIADFCNQPDGLLKPELASIFRQAALEALSESDALRKRLALLEPLYQLKWACICLNGFLPGGRFDPDRPDRSPKAQIARARLMAARAEERLKSGE